MSSFVSIIIPCYNQGEFLSDAIQSALDQDYPDKEIIVVNDGSTDNTQEAAAQFLPAIRYIEQENRGVSSARNAAIKIAKGTYVAFLDSDDVLLPGSIAKRTAYLESHPETAFICSDSIYFNESGMVGLRSKLLGKPKNSYNFRWETVDYNATLSTVMLRSVCFDKAGLFEESIKTAEDWLMWVQISLHFNMAYLDEPLIKYRLHGNNATQRIGLDNVDHRSAISQVIHSPPFRLYPDHFKAQLLFLRFASVFRFRPKHESLKYFMMAVKTDPFQIGFGLKVIYRGLKNVVRRQKNKQ